jgi:hypothetical protein
MGTGITAPPGSSLSRDEESRQVIRVQWFVRAAGVIVMTVVVAACSPPDAGTEPQAVVTSTVSSSPPTTAPPGTTATAGVTEPPSTDPTEVVDEAGAVPAELVGTWQSLDQGSAEDLIEIHADGSYLRAMVLMQQRPSGVFSYSIGTKGNVEVQGTSLRVVPTEGTESMTDPDAPGDSYTDKPTDLTPEVYEWSVSGGSLFLDGQYGVVEFRPST